MNPCRNCKGDLVEFLDLGRVPLANQLLSSPKDPYRKHPLGLAACESCTLVQLTHVVPANEMYRSYPYATGSSAVHKDHFDRMAQDVLEFTKKGGAPPGLWSGLVLDIGSNDGTLLAAFQERGMMGRGVEPASNLAKVASEKGVETFNVFFDQRFADWFVKDQGQADIVTATNVLTHVDNLDDLLAAVKTILKPDGWFVTETYYLPSIVNGNLWDMIYHEHLTYFTVHTLKDLMERRGFHLAYAQKVPVHGGSIRAYFQTGKKPDAFVLQPDLVLEHMELTRFAARVQVARKEIRHFVRDARKAGKTVIGYSAPAKATTLLNVCGLTVKDIPFVVDDSPLKQGKFIPGTGIPIFSPDTLSWWKSYTDLNKGVDYAIIFAHNLIDEIAPKLKARGIRAFVPLPEFREV